MKIDSSVKKGFSYGLTSGVITTLGLMVGLDASTHSKLAVIGGVLTIAVADALSDAMGMHVSEESEDKFAKKEIWEATLVTFVTKFVFALSFVIPLILLPIQISVIVSVIYGMLVLSLLSYKIAKDEKESPVRAVFEHLIMGMCVVFVTYYFGNWIGKVFN